MPNSHKEKPSSTFRSRHWVAFKNFDTFLWFCSVHERNSFYQRSLSEFLKNSSWIPTLKSRTDTIFVLLLLLLFFCSPQAPLNFLRPMQHSMQLCDCLTACENAAITSIWDLNLSTLLSFSGDESPVIHHKRKQKIMFVEMETVGSSSTRYVCAYVSIFICLSTSMYLYNK